jgi:pyruvate ferredoxin oxidoreductase delta subunit
MAQDLGWKDLPQGDVLKAATALEFETGDWRTRRPVKDDKLCINCLFCYIYCPDSAVKVKDGKFDGIDYRYCKGCGVCENVCPVKPVKAVRMEKDK